MGHFSQEHCPQGKFSIFRSGYLETFTFYCYLEGGPHPICTYQLYIYIYVISNQLRDWYKWCFHGKWCFIFWEGANAWNGMLKLYPPQVSGRVDTTGWFEQLFLMSCFRSNPWHWMAGDPHQKMAGCSFLRVKLSPNDLIFPNDSLVNKDSTGKSQKNNRWEILHLLENFHCY